MCHHHQAACPSKLLRCTCKWCFVTCSAECESVADSSIMPSTTVMRPNGQRCQLQYCNTVLAKVYNVDRQAIVEAGRNRYGVDPRKHCSSAEARYLWAVSERCC